MEKVMTYTAQGSGRVVFSTSRVLFGRHGLLHLAQAVMEADAPVVAGARAANRQRSAVLAEVRRLETTGAASFAGRSYSLEGK